jgi:hypothetical protein
MGASVSTVYYNLKLKHPTLDMPLIDYDLALLMQPMLMLGVSIGVIFNVIFADCSPDHPFPMGREYCIPDKAREFFFFRIAIEAMIDHVCISKLNNSHIDKGLSQGC